MTTTGPTRKMTRTSMSFAMAMEFSTGPMEPITRGNGTSTRLRAKEPSGMPKEMSTGVSSRTIWPTATESTLTSMEANTKESSRTMSKRDTEKRSGSMEPSMSAHIRTE